MTASDPRADTRRPSPGYVSVIALWAFILSALTAGSVITFVDIPEQCDCEFHASWNGSQWVNVQCEPVDCPGGCHESPPSGGLVFCFCHFGTNTCKCWGKKDEWGNLLCQESGVSPCPNDKDCLPPDDPQLGEDVLVCECRTP